MNKNQKPVLIIIGVILGLIVLIVVVVSLLNKDNSNNPNNPNEPNQTNPQNNSFNKEISRLNNTDELFKVQNAINNFYQLILNQNFNDLIKVLTLDYQNKNGLNKDNILTKFTNINGDPSYTIQEIYYNDHSNITYYFVNGYLYITPFGSGETSFTKDLKFLVIMDKQNNYYLEPIDSSLNIKEYATNYDLKEISINSNIKVTSSIISEQNKLTIYLSEYYNKILLFDNQMAYNMLYDDTKLIYQDADTLNQNIENIYNKYTSKIFAYNKEQKDGYTLYSVIDSNQNHIKIYEYNIMNYKISL